MRVVIKSNPNERFECLYKGKYIVTLFEGIKFTLICDKTGDKMPGEINYNIHQGYVWISNEELELHYLRDGMKGII